MLTFSPSARIVPPRLKSGPFFSPATVTKKALSNQGFWTQERLRASWPRLLQNLPPPKERLPPPNRLRKKRFGGKRLKIALIVLAVMAVQAVAAALLLPKGQATPASGQAAEAGHVTETHVEKPENLVEAEIGASVFRWKKTAASFGT